MSIDESSSHSISSSEFKTCVKVLSHFINNDEHLSIQSDEYSRIRPLIFNLYKIGRRLRPHKNKVNHLPMKPIGRKIKKSVMMTETVIQEDDKVVTKEQLAESKSCHLCQLEYSTLHFFYDFLCPSCAKLNYGKRLQTTDLTNCVALVTCGRIKIGYRIILKLLRSNCFVITTSRFPNDFVSRLTKEQDFEQWKHRVHIYRIDLRYVQHVERLAKLIIEKYARLDFLINNTCQSIQQSNESYQYLIEHETLNNYALIPEDHQNILEGNQQLVSISNQIQLESSLCPSYLPSDCHKALSDLSSVEINEVFTINTLAPFILNSQLKILMRDKHPTPNSIKFIINVSSIESTFSQCNKTDQHPHINAANAALNMLTRTSAIDYQTSNIYMVSIDTG